MQQGMTSRVFFPALRVEKNAYGFVMPRADENKSGGNVAAGNGTRQQAQSKEVPICASTVMRWQASTQGRCNLLPATDVSELEFLRNHSGHALGIGYGLGVSDLPSPRDRPTGDCLTSIRVPLQRLCCENRTSSTCDLGTSSSDYRSSTCG